MSLFKLLLCITVCFNFGIGQDWAGLSRYQDENLPVLSGEQEAPRVIMMGNSITEGWPKFSMEFFKKHPVLSRGISGQTSPQMLLRFRQDVIALKPEVVIILAGTNDVAENTGPISNEQILDNIRSMCDLAEQNGIQVVLCSILPAESFRWRPEMRPATRIMQLNSMIKELANSRGYPYVDYHKAMGGTRGELLPQYTYDGVHPDAQGYLKMEDILLNVVPEFFEQENH